MSVIVNSAWKGKKSGSTVKYQGTEYVIGSTAFASVNDAVAGGNTTDLVIVNKSLSSPVTVNKEKKSVTGAATGIFASTVKETESKDSLTKTTKIDFSASAGGSAKLNANDPAELVGFKEVTASKSSGVYYGGSQKTSYSNKDVDKSASSGEVSTDMSSSIKSEATGTLKANGTSSAAVDVAVGSIQDSTGYAAVSNEKIKETYGKIFSKTDDEAYAEKNGAAYANITLQYAEIKNAQAVGGSFNEKTTSYEKAKNDDKEFKYTYSYSDSVNGTATLTDVSGNASLKGFKTVKVTASSSAESAPAAVVNNIDTSTKSVSASKKFTYTADKSSSYEFSNKVSTNGKGTVTVTGKSSKSAYVNGRIAASNVTLKYATSGAAQAGTYDYEKKLSVKATQKSDSVSLSGSLSVKTETKAGSGTFSATNSTIAGAQGFKKVTVKASAVNGDFDSLNIKTTASCSISGISKNSLLTDPTEYDVTELTNLLDTDQSYSHSHSSETKKSAGGSSFDVSGKSSGIITGVNGFKSVTLNNDDKTGSALTVSGIVNENYTSKEKNSVKYTADKSFSTSVETSSEHKAEGKLTAKGNVTAGKITGFESVQVNGTLSNNVKYTSIAGFEGQNKVSSSSKTKNDNKVTNDGYSGKFTASSSTNSTATSTLTVSKANVSGAYSALKTATITDSDITSATFDGAANIKNSASKEVTWTPDELKETFENFTGKMTDDKITSFKKKYSDQSSSGATLSIKNSTKDDIVSLGISGFKQVSLTNVDVARATLSGSAAEKTSNDLSRSVTTSKRSQSQKYTKTSTPETTFSLTGKSKELAKMTGTGATATDMKNVTLKDAQLANINLSSYSTSDSKNYTESVSMKDGSVTSANFKYSSSYTESGSGSFTASFSDTSKAQEALVSGSLNGYSSVSLANVSLGGANAANWTLYGNDTMYVPVNQTTGDYFDAIKNLTETTPSGKKLTGNISGSYSVDKNDAVKASWTATSGKYASGNFTLTNSKYEVADVTVGAISGYGTVTLENVTAGAINGNNTSKSTVINYQTNKNGDVLTDSEVTVDTREIASSVKVTGKKISGNQKIAKVGAITGYSSVTFDNAISSGNVTVDPTVTTTAINRVDGVTYVKTVDTNKAAAGTFSAKLSDSIATVAGNIDGYSKVELTNANVSNVTGGSMNITSGYTSESATTSDLIYSNYKAEGSFTAKSTITDSNTKAVTQGSVGNIYGFKQVALTDYSAGNVTGGATTEYAFTKADSDRDTKDTYEATLTLGTKLTASVSTYGTDKKLSSDTTKIGNIEGYASVVLTNLASVGAIKNGGFTYTSVYGSKDTATYYGAYSSKKVDGKYTSASATVSGDAIISGYSAEKATKVTGSILGFKNITMSNVKIGSAAANIVYQGGNFKLTSKTSNDVTTTTEVFESVGELSIADAKWVGGTIEVKGFKDVAIDVAGAAQFTNITGGTSTKVDGEQKYETYKFTRTTDFATGSNLYINTDYGTITGDVKGYGTMTFTNTDVTGTITGYTTNYQKVSGEYATVFDAVSAVIFNNNDGDLEKTTTVTVNKIDNAASVTFNADGNDTYTVKSITSEVDDKAIINVKCDMTMNFAGFTLNSGDTINIADGNFLYAAADDATIVTKDALVEYFKHIAGTTFTSNGSATVVVNSNVTDEEFQAAVKDAGFTTTNVVFQQSGLIKTNENVTGTKDNDVFTVVGDGKDTFVFNKKLNALAGDDKLIIGKEGIIVNTTGINLGDGIDTFTTITGDATNTVKLTGSLNSSTADLKATFKNMSVEVYEGNFEVTTAAGKGLTVIDAPNTEFSTEDSTLTITKGAVADVDGYNEVAFCEDGAAGTLKADVTAASYAYNGTFASATFSALNEAFVGKAGYAYDFYTADDLANKITFANKNDFLWSNSDKLTLANIDFGEGCDSLMIGFDTELTETYDNIGDLAEAFGKTNVDVLDGYAQEIKITVEVTDYSGTNFDTDVKDALTGKGITATNVTFVKKTTEA